LDDSISLVTRVSLLLRIRDDDGRSRSEAWFEFVERYGRLIHDWCLHRQLQPADAEDVTQEVLVRLARALKTFEYNPELTFRGWLRRVTENALADFFRDKGRRAKMKQSDSTLETLKDAEARADLVQRLEQSFDLELFERAAAMVQKRVETRRWQAWHLTAIEKMAVEDVSQQLQMKVPTVYSSRYQVQKKISEELQRLEHIQTESLCEQPDNDPQQQRTDGSSRG